MSRQKQENKWVKKICPSCNKEFESLKSKNKKYCSSECAKNHFEKQIPERECDVCGKIFIPHSSVWNKYLRGEQEHLTCSVSCASKLKVKAIPVKCENCGKLIFRTPYRLSINKHQFCSNDCQMEFQHSEAFEIRECEICGKEFECSKISTQRFCSIQCQGKWQSTQTGDLNPRSKKVHKDCNYCGKDILVKPYKLEQQDCFFCSTECRQNWFAEVLSQTDEWKEKSSMWAVKILEDGLVPFVYTKPQLSVNSILDDMNINYKNDYGIKYYSIDNYLHDYHLMIEVMGDYWHSNPLVFNYSELNDIQYKRIPKDKAKHTYTVNNYNIEILYVWENDINNNLDLCRHLIDEYINNNGILENYHSFNYELVDNKLKLKDNIILAYQDYNVIK